MLLLYVILTRPLLPPFICLRSISVVLNDYRPTPITPFPSLGLIEEKKSTLTISNTENDFTFSNPLLIQSPFVFSF